MKTEAEAKLCWCPFARVHVPAGLINRVSGALRRIMEKALASGNRADGEYIQEQIADCNCLASECMAWRWAALKELAPSETRADNHDYSIQRGYCGLAVRS